jgi:hypothetical protein
MTFSPFVEGWVRCVNAQVIAAARVRHRAVGGNVQCVLEFAHLRDAVFRRHLIHFDGGEIRRSSGQAIGRRAF